MQYLSTSSKLYQDFIDIDKGAYHTIIRFYEANLTEILLLKFKVYFDMLANYTNALFEVGAYAKHVEEVDTIIQLSIQKNIQFYKGEDIYFKSLFQKAASHYNLLEYQKAEHILKELIKIAPYHGLSIRFLKKCLASSQPSYIKNARATSIFLFLTTAFIAAIEVIFIHSFATEWIRPFEYLRFGVFGLGIFVLVGTYCFHYYQVDSKVNQFLKKVRRKY